MPRLYSWINKKVVCLASKHNSKHPPDYTTTRPVIEQDIKEEKNNINNNNIKSI